MSRKQILKLIRQDELRRFREYVEDRPQPYTCYVRDLDAYAYWAPGGGDRAFSVNAK
jgi:hypothetical protein